MPSRKIEEQVEALSLLRSSGASPESEAALRKALRERVNVVVAKAATIIAEFQLRALIPDLSKAFERLFESAAQVDPQCWGKTAIAKALKDLGHAESATFRRGLRHIQMEPVWGGEEDTATALRSTCTLALVQCTDISRLELLTDLVDKLTEGAAPVRMDAARALEQLEGHEPALLLRLKARTGDSDPAVTGQVLESLLRLEEERAVTFVAEFLEFADDEVREQAALALGVSRLSSAITLLKDHWTKWRATRPEPVLLRAISASRHDSAIEFLLEIIRDGREREALEALQALQFHLDSKDICARAEKAVEIRGGVALREHFAQNFRPHRD
jgi:HEAT repeat protein